MKLSQIRAKVAREDESVAIPIFQKDGEPYLGADGGPSTISVVGSESRQYRTARHAAFRRFQRRARSASATLTPEESEVEEVELLAAAVTGWHGWEDDDDRPLPCTPENVKALLTIHTDIRQQVNAGVHQHEVFSARASVPSSNTPGTTGG